MKASTKKGLFTAFGALIVGVAVYEYKRRREGGRRHVLSRSLRRKGW